LIATATNSQYRPAASPADGARRVDRHRCSGRKTPPPPNRENRGTTSRRFPNENNGPSYRKPRGGAPRGNTNALKHGYFSAANAARRVEVQALLNATRELIAQMEATRALVIASGLATRTVRYVSTHSYADGSGSKRVSTVEFCGRRLLRKTVEICRWDTANRTEAMGSKHPQKPASSPVELADPALDAGQAKPAASLPRMRPAIRSRANKARRSMLFRRSARPKRNPPQKVLTEAQNQPRTFSRVSDLFAADSLAAPRRD
jgi:hypothetical protein